VAKKWSSLVKLVIKDLIDTGNVWCFEFVTGFCKVAGKINCPCGDNYAGV